LVVTKPRSGARPAGRLQPGLGGSGVAGQGRGPTCATGAALAEVRRGATREAPTGAERCGSGQGVAGAASPGDLAAAAHAWKRCEREISRRKKRRTRVLYPLMFIRPTH
jgi:hypothetical protein